MGSIVTRTHLHLSWVVVMTVFRVVAGRREEIDEEGHDPKGENKSHDPFKDGTGLGSAPIVARDKGNSEDD